MKHPETTDLFFFFFFLIYCLIKDVIWHSCLLTIITMGEKEIAQEAEVERK